MTSEAHRARERQRLRDAADRARRRRSHQLALHARTLARLDDLDRELADAEAGLAELDAAEAER